MAISYLETCPIFLTIDLKSWDFFFLSALLFSFNLSLSSTSQLLVVPISIIKAQKFIHFYKNYVNTVGSSSKNTIFAFEEIF